MPLENTRSKSRNNVVTSPSPSSVENNQTLFDYIDNKFANLQKEMFKKIELEMAETKKATDFIAQKYDEILDKLKDLAGINIEVEKMKKDLLRMNHIDIRLAELEQINLSNQIEISGVDENTNENPIETAKNIASKLGIEISNEDFSDVYRVPDRRQGFPRKIIIKFHNSSIPIRHNLLAAKNKTKKLSSSLYIGEVLSAYNKDLLWKTKKRAQELNYQYTWFKNGKVFTRKSTESKVINIKHERDLLPL